jgi:hypothetical protein
MEPDQQQVLERLAREAVGRLIDLARVARNGVVPIRQRTRMVPMGHGARQSITDIVPAAEDVLVDVLPRSHGDQLGVKELAELLTGLAGFSRWIAARMSGGTPESLRLHATERLVLVLAHRVCRRDAFEVDAARWVYVAKGFLDFVDRGEITREVVAPIQGIEQEEAVGIGDGITLRPLTDDEEAYFYMSHDRVFHPPHTAIAIVRRVPFETTNLSEEGLVVDVLNALRIWTGKQLAITELSRHDDWGGFGRSSKIFSTTPAFGGAPLRDANAFCRFWDEVRAALAHPPDALRVALNRLRTMNEQPRGSDRILDQMIIFEALFLGDGEKQELGYRLRMRAAHFLGDTLEERVEIAETLKAAYDVRSRIAHGSELSEEQRETQSRMDALTALVLRRYFLEASRRRVPRIEREIIREMDRRMLEQSPRDTRA